MATKLEDPRDQIATIIVGLSYNDMRALGESIHLQFQELPIDQDRFTAELFDWARMQLEETEE
jgi:hypothetical protein